MFRWLTKASVIVCRRLSSRSYICYYVSANRRSDILSVLVTCPNTLCSEKMSTILQTRYKQMKEKVLGDNIETLVRLKISDQMIDACLLLCYFHLLCLTQFYDEYYSK